MDWRYLLALAGVTSILMLSPAAPAAQTDGDADMVVIDVEKVLAGKGVKPSTRLSRQFSTYTLFLFPSPRWLKTSTAPAIVDQLEEAFQRFGRASGDNNLAIWLR